MGTRSQRLILAVIVLLFLAVIVFLVVRSARRTEGTPTPQATSTGTATSHKIGIRTKTNGCVANGPLADGACTPGQVLTTDTKAICTPGYASSVRNVPTSEKNAVYAEYGIKTHAPGQYEIDHLISLQLGGSNDVANLWPEPAEPKPGFHEKDAVENYLHDQICSGRISIEDAQYQIATNWLEIYYAMPASKKRGSSAENP